MSALPLKADIRGIAVNVCFVPQAENSLGQSDVVVAITTVLGANLLGALDRFDHRASSHLQP